MTAWINLAALWRIAVLGLVCGAGLPAVFAVGLRVLAQPSTGTRQVPSSAGRVSPTWWAVPAAGVCFALVTAAIGWGIYLIVAGG